MASEWKCACATAGRGCEGLNIGGRAIACTRARNARKGRVTFNLKLRRCSIQCHGSLGFGWALGDGEADSHATAVKSKAGEE